MRGSGSLGDGWAWAGRLVVGVIGLVAVLLVAAPASANPNYASIVVDAHSGTVLRARHADKLLHPASLTKMMTLYMLFEALDEGRLRYDTPLHVSERAASMQPSKIGVRAGTTITVEDAIMALVTKSANDVAVVVAEALGGSEWEFAQAMTERARLLGMSRTRFRNASGLHHERQVSTARDMAVLAQALIFRHRDKYNVFGRESWRYRGALYRSHNRLLSSYAGMDGLKTGYIRASGFNLAASAVRDGRRLIGVVFGGRSAQSRNDHMARILDQGFARADQLLLARKAFPDPPAAPRKPGVYDRAIALAEAAPVAPRKPGTPAPDGFQLASRAIAAEPQDAGGTESAHLEALARSTWSVQVGAFARQDSISVAIGEAMRAAPELLADAHAFVVPLATRRGVIYRARLVGLDQRTAAQVCARLDDCLAIAPRP